MKPRQTILPVCLVISFILLTGCLPFLKTPEPVTIVSAVPRYDLTYYQSLLPEFNKQYPNITIELSPYDDSPPGNSDTVVIPWFFMQNLEEEGDQYLALDAYLAQEEDFGASQFFPGAFEAFQSSGKQLGVPLGIDPFVLYYNRDLFDSMGVPYPQPGWTWSDFLALGRSLRDEESGTYGYTHATSQFIDSMMFVYQHGGSLVDANGRPSLTDPLTVEAIQWYIDLFRTYNVAPTDEQAERLWGSVNQAGIGGITTGKVGMFISYLSAYSGDFFFPGDLNIDFGMIELPRDEVSFTLAFFEGGVISSQSAHPDDAWKWLAFLSRQRQPRLIPARISQAESPEYAQEVGSEVARVGLASVNSAMFVSGRLVNQLGSIIEIYFKAIDTLVNSDVAVEEELIKAQDAAEARIP